MSSWTLTSQGPWTKRRKHQVVAWRNQILLLGGFDGETSFDLNDVWSWQGQSWTQVTEHAGWSGRDGHTAVVLNDAIYVLAGTDDPFQCKNDVWRSIDGGRTWEELIVNAPWPERWQHASCRHGDRIYLSGGWGEKFFNDVWYSEDGKHWVLACAAGPWKPRMFHSMASFNGKLFIFGGHDGKTQLRDVWMSADNGGSWTMIATSAPWHSRQGHSIAVSKDHIYMMGGFGGAQRFNDCWKTADGVNWVQVSEQCEWSARQGHASTFSQGSIYICGGFDEGGYSNSVYRCVIDSDEAASSTAGASSNTAASSSGGHSASDPSASASSAQPTSQTSGQHVQVDSLLPCLTGLSELYELRDRRDKMIRDIVFSVGVVTKVFKLPESNRKRTASTAELNNAADGERRLSSDGYGGSIGGGGGSGGGSGVGIAETVSPRVSSEPDFSRFGSPFRENGLSSAMKDTKNFAVNEDMQLQLWQKLTEMSVEFAEGDAAAAAIATIDDEMATTTTPRGTVMKLGSAALHEAIELDKRRIIKLQQTIRQAAEVENAESIPVLIDQRADIAQHSLGQVEALHKHVANVRNLYNARNEDLLEVINQLEDIKKAYHNAFLQTATGTAPSTSTAQQESDPTHRRPSYDSKHKRRSWEMVVARSVEIIHMGNDAACEQAMQDLKQCFDDLAAVSQDIARHLAPASVQSQLLGTLAEPPELTTRLTSLLTTQYQLTQGLQRVAHEEASQLRNTLEELLTLLRDTVTEGIDMVQVVYSQSMAMLTEISRLHDDLSEWKEQLQRWLPPTTTLKAHCDKLVGEVAALEDTLLHWENTRIDLKSAVEKAVLTMNRSKTLRSHGEAAQLQSNEVDRLRQQLVTAEKEAKQARRALRTWYRSHRHFAVNTAPELFLALPDLRAPGSVLGDGGFASSANIPRRQLHEYDDVVVFTQPDDDGRPPVPPQPATVAAVGTAVPPSLQSNKPSPAGRHLLLKASYEGQEVILKGFAMHNHEQRKGMDREIEILSRLKSDLVIHPQAIVDASSDATDPTLQITLFIEYPYYTRGNLASWLKHEERKPWELQAIARQVLFAIMYLHDHGIVHKDIKPSNILLNDDGRILLTDFELARVVVTTSRGKAAASADASSSLLLAHDLDDDTTMTVTRSGTSGYMAPEVEMGQSTGLSSDMYSFGCLLYFMHFPREFSQLIASQVTFPRGHQADADLCDLIQQLLAVDPQSRPTAATALTHAYFRATFVDRLMQEGEIVEQDRKLDAVRNLLSRTRAANRNVFDRLTISRATVAEDVLRYFQEVDVDHLRRHLKVTFANEPGIDEGGLLTEMFSLFFDAVFRPSFGLFEDCNDTGMLASSSMSPAAAPGATGNTRHEALMSVHSTSSDLGGSGQGASSVHDGGSGGGGGGGEGDDAATMVTEHDIVLPSAHVPSEQLSKLRAVGRAMVKALYEGRRIGSRLCPSVWKYFTGAAPTILDLQLFDAQAAKSLRWLLTTVGVEDLGLHFEEVGRSDLGDVTDANKAQYVRLKVQRILIDSREASLTALRTGFMEALQGVSTEAAPFLTLLSHTDWRIMLCGDTVVNVHQIISALKFSNFPRRSKIPQWLTEILLTLSEDMLRKFLVFVTGSPSLSQSFLSTSSSSTVKINVRHQHRSAALPTAHTCFFYLDIPDYDDRSVFQSKLMFAIQNANTFEIV